MTKQEKIRQQALFVINRIERNLEIQSLCHAGQLIRTGRFTKLELQSLISNLQPKREFPNVH